MRTEDLLEKIQHLEKQKQILIGSLIGLGGISLMGILWLLKCNKNEKKWSNKTPKNSMLDLIGNTPIIYLKTLSKILEVDIYVPFFKIVGKIRKSKSWT